MILKLVIILQLYWKKKTTSWKIQPRGILADPVMELNKTGPPSGSWIHCMNGSTTVVHCLEQIWCSHLERGTIMMLLRTEPMSPSVRDKTKLSGMEPNLTTGTDFMKGVSGTDPLPGRASLTGMTRWDSSPTRRWRWSWANNEKRRHFHQQKKPQHLSTKKITIFYVFCCCNPME